MVACWIVRQKTNKSFNLLSKGILNHLNWRADVISCYRTCHVAQYRCECLAVSCETWILFQTSIVSLFLPFTLYYPANGRKIYINTTNKFHSRLWDQSRNFCYSMSSANRHQTQFKIVHENLITFDKKNKQKPGFVCCK